MITTNDKHLVCIGAGPKCLAIAILLFALRHLRGVRIGLTVIEQKAVGSNWAGESGYTDGDFPLDTSPFKDLGFPYQSGYGREIDQYLARYSFIEFLKDRNEFASFVSRGNYKASHRRFSQYQCWVADRLDLDITQGTATRIAPGADGQVVTAYDCPYGATYEVLADGVVVTGPGHACRVPEQDDDPHRIFTGRSYWMARAALRELGKARFAVIGGGQSAGTAAMSLLQENPLCEVDLINSRGFLSAQSAGYFENSMCSTPDGTWTSLPIDERREFLNRTNNGVIDTDIKARLDQSERFRVLRGRVEAVRSEGGKACVSFGGNQNGSALKYDAVIVAIGFNPTSQVQELIVPHLVADGWIHRFNVDQRVDENLRLPIDGFNIHVPALAALSQGPGYSLLSCLGSVASRVVSAYLPHDVSSTPARVVDSNELCFWC